MEERVLAEPTSADNKGVIDDLFPDARTISLEERYQKDEDFKGAHPLLTLRVQKTIRKLRIQVRLIRMLVFAAELIEGGEVMRQLTQTEITRRLGWSKSAYNRAVAQVHIKPVRGSR